MASNSNVNVILDTKAHTAKPVILVNSFEVADTSTGTNKRKTSGKEVQFSQKRYTITDSLSVISDMDSRKKGKGKSRKGAQPKKAKSRKEPITVDFLSTDDNNVSVVFEPGFRIKSQEPDNLPKRKRSKTPKAKGGIKKPRKPTRKVGKSKSRPMRYSQFVDRFSFKKKPNSSSSGQANASGAPSVKSIGTNTAGSRLHFLQELDSYPIFQDCWNGPNMPPYHLERFDFPSTDNSVSDITENSSDWTESETSSTVTDELSEQTSNSAMITSRSSNVPIEKHKQKRVTYASNATSDSYVSNVPTEQSSPMSRSLHSILTSSSSGTTASYSWNVPTEKHVQKRVSYASKATTDERPEREGSYMLVDPTGEGSQLSRSCHSSGPSRRSSIMKASYNSNVPTEKSLQKRVSYKTKVSSDERPETEASYNSNVPTEESSQWGLSYHSIVPSNSSEARMSCSSRFTTEESSQMKRPFHSIVPSNRNSEARISCSLTVPAEESAQIRRSYHSIVPSNTSSEARISCNLTVPTVESAQIRRSYHSISPSNRSSEARISCNLTVPTEESSQIRRSYHSIAPSNRSSEARISCNLTVPTVESSQIRRSYHSIVPSNRSSEARISCNVGIQTDEGVELILSDYSNVSTEESSRLTMSDISSQSRMSQQQVRSLFDLDTYTYPVVDARLNKGKRPYRLAIFEYPTSPVHYANLLSEETSDMSESDTSIAGPYQNSRSIFGLYSYPVVDACLKGLNRPYAMERLDMCSSLSVRFASDKGKVRAGPRRLESDSRSSVSFTSQLPRSFAELVSPWRVVHAHDGSITPRSVESLESVHFEYSMDYENCADSGDASNDDEDYLPSMTSLGSWSSMSTGVTRSSVSRDDISDICTSVSSMWNNMFIR